MQQWGPPYQPPGYPPQQQWPQQPQGYGYAPAPQAYAPIVLAPQAYPPSLFVCRCCGFQGRACQSSKVSTGGVVLAIFLFLTFFGILLFWIPLVTMRDTRMVCPRCQVPA